MLERAAGVLSLPLFMRSNPMVYSLGYRCRRVGFVWRTLHFMKHNGRRARAGEGWAASQFTEWGGAGLLLRECVLLFDCHVRSVRPR